MKNYYIGDLCYILPQDLYDKMVCSFKYETGEWFTVDGVRFAFGSTADGDGEFVDNVGRKYPVDAGILGIVELNAAFVPKNISNEHGDLGHIVQFEEEPLVVTCDGNFRFGNICIDTRDQEDEYYEGD